MRPSRLSRCSEFRSAQPSSVRPWPPSIALWRNRCRSRIPAGLAKPADYSQVALVGPGKLVITGTQLGFGTADADVRLAFERLGKALESNQANFKDVVYARMYPVSYEVGDRLRALRFEFFDKSRPPASTLLPFESLPSLDASFGVEVIAAPR